MGDIIAGTVLMVSGLALIASIDPLIGVGVTWMVFGFSVLSDASDKRKRNNTNE